MDKGLGIKYERFAFFMLMKRVFKKYGISSALEVPANGAAGTPGINTAIMERLGLDVSVCNEKEKISEIRRVYSEINFKNVKLFEMDGPKVPSRDASYDLVWNFAELPRIQNPELFVKEMKRVSKKLVMIVVQNSNNPGLSLHRIYHERTREPWAHGSADVMNLENVKRIFEKTGIKIVEDDYFDLPPWPDLATPVSELMPGIIFGKTCCDSPKKTHFFDFNENDAAMKELFRLESVLPDPIRKKFSHLCYVVGRV